MLIRGSAKFAQGLIRHIYEHARAEGWIPPGSVVLDPFAGVALGALHALRLGCAWIGNELEPRFFTLAQENLAKWMAEYQHLPGWGPWAMITLGDSRELTRLLPRQVGLCIGSPPYTGNNKHDYRVVDAYGHDRDMRRGYRQGLGCFRGSETYGTTPGQLGALPLGHIDTVISSPPYANRCASDNQRTLTRTGLHKGFNEGDGGTYGDTDGQLSTLPTGHIDAVIASPPFSQSTHVNKNPHDMTAGKAVWKDGHDSAARAKQDYASLDTPGNLAIMPHGHIDTVISSPPYADSWHKAETTATAESRMRKAGYSDEYIKHQFRASNASGGNMNAQEYGETPGQLGALPTGTIECVVSSPPFGAAQSGGGIAARMRGEGTYPVITSLPTNSYQPAEQGVSLGNLANDTPDTFWIAARAILEQTFSLLRPNAHAIFVTKRYCRAGAIIDFTADWIRLCERVGFTLLHHHRAMLIENHGTQCGLFDEDTQYVTQKKSFFRRLHEKKRPDLSIDWEDVLCFTTPHTQGSPDAPLPQ